MNRTITLVLILLAWLSSAACSRYRVAEDSTRLRYLPEEDALLVLEVQLGIVSRDREDLELEQAAQDLIRAAEGRRQYPPQGGLFTFNLEREYSAEDKAQPWHADLVELAKSVRVETSRVFLDGDERLCFVRLTRIDRFRRFLEIANMQFNRAVLEAEPGTPKGGEFPAFDEPTANAIRSAIANNHAWLSIQGGALVLELPMTQANAARCLAWLTRESAKNHSWQVILDAASSLEITEEHARLRFGEPTKRTIEFSSKEDVEGYDRALRRALDGRLPSMGTETTLQEVRARFESERTPAAGEKIK